MWLNRLKALALPTVAQPADPSPPAEEAASAPVTGKAAVLDRYTTDEPSPLTALRIFDGNWSSYIPGFGMGEAQLFDDFRIKWLGEQMGGFADKRILELGPLECGHTWMMTQAGAREIVAIESNSAAYLKCLIVKSLLKFDADIQHGDFRPYLANCPDRYDFVLASGVLYHMTDPLQAIKDICSAAPRVGLWTHYYDSGVIDANPDLRRKFATEPKLERFGDIEIQTYKQEYQSALQWEGFCGGSEAHSFWMTRQSLTGALQALGFDVAIGHETTDHPNGPAILIFAERK